MLEAHQPHEPDLHGNFIEPRQFDTGKRRRLMRLRLRCSGGSR